MKNTEEKKRYNEGGPDYTSAARQAAHRERLEAAKGKRVIVDLDAEAVEALTLLRGSGYGETQVAVVRRALIDAEKELTKRSKKMT